MNYTFIKKNIFKVTLILGFVLIPFATIQAQYSYDYGGYDYGGYDYGGYDYSYDYGGYDYGGYDYGGYDYSYDYGNYDYTYDYGNYDYTYDYGNYDYTYDYGNYDYTYDYGNYDYTYDYGNYDYSYDYGDYDYTYDYGDYDGDFSYENQDYYTDVDYYSDEPYYSYENDYYSNYSYPQFSYDYGSSCSRSRCSNNSNSTQDVIVNNTNVNNNNNEVIIIDERDDDDDNTDNGDNLDVVCTVSDTSVDEGDTVTFTANVSGGDAPYTYNWNGDIDSNSRIVNARFNEDGTYNVSVTVRDNNGRTASDSCATVRVNGDDDNNDDEDLNVQCEVSDTSVDNRDYVTINVDIDGGNSPYEINWDGDTDEFDSFDKHDNSQRVRVDTNQNRVELEVTVEDDDGNEKSDTCIIRVNDNDDDDNNIRVIETDSDLTNLSSVFLSQVPYTGSEDILKTVGFIFGLLIWGAIVATVLLRNKNKKEISSKASAFKEANRLKKFSN